MPLSTYSLNVPCKGYIKKYFSCLYGDPVTLDHKTDFGDTIFTKMTARPLYRLNHHNINQAFLFFDSQLKFQLPADFFYRIDLELTKQQIYNINRYLENCFRADLFMIINCATFFGVEIRTTIEAFARKHEIILEEDITYEALQKSYYRYKKSSVAKNNFLVQMNSPYKPNLRA
ncbi:MAG: hypothetical protein ACJ748_01640 [Flavisolibacter sp.]